MASRRNSADEASNFFSWTKAGGRVKGQRSRGDSQLSTPARGSVASLNEVIPDYQLFEGSVWPTTSIEDSIPDLRSTTLEGERESQRSTLTQAQLSDIKLPLNGLPSSTFQGNESHSKAPETTHRFSLTQKDLASSHPPSRRASFTFDQPTSGSRRTSLHDLNSPFSPTNTTVSLVSVGTPNRSSFSPVSISQIPSRDFSIILEKSHSGDELPDILKNEKLVHPSPMQQKEDQLIGFLKEPEKPSDLCDAAPLTPNNYFSMISVGTTEIAYPALLSEVASQFKSLIQFSTHTKDSIDYQDSFMGHHAISTLCSILKSQDRTLATLVGRVLAAQGFIFDVTYSKKLKDSKKEIYRCHRSVPGETSTAESFPTGVFTILTDCYVSTCTTERFCYSVSCPRKLAQRMRIKDSQAIHRTTSLDIKEKNDQLWCMSVPQEVLESVSDSERKRQEIIFEVIQTEREFVEDLLVIQRVFVGPLMESDIIEPIRRENFLSSVFLNMRELFSVNSKLFRKLIARQNENYVVYSVGDIFVNIVDQFYPYVEYGSQQAMAKFLLDEEKSNNPEFVKFLKECEKKKECRKLPLESFLSRPTTRMGRYPLFLKSMYEKVPDNHPDKKAIPQALLTLKDILSKINAEAGKAENVLKLSRLQKQILFNSGEEVDLHLNAENRRICREGTLTLKRGAATESEVTVFLFDHLLLMAKKKDNGTYKVYKKPIPLELLVCKKYDRAIPLLPQAIDQVAHVAQKASIVRISSHVGRPPSSMSQIRPDVRSNLLTITHLGRNGGMYTLSTYSSADRQAWMDAIENQQKLLMDKKRVFELLSLDANVFKLSNRVNCSTSYSSLLILGTDDGLYTGPERVSVSSEFEEVPPKFTKVLNLEKVMQVDVLPDHDMLVVLADRNLFTFTLDVLDAEAHPDSGASRKGKKIGSHVSFFKQGVCAERTLVCAVKSTSLTATIKVLEPVGLGGSRLRGKLGKLFRTTNDSLRVFKEFYIPTESRSIHYLRTKLCVGCTKGFEIVDLETLNTQGLLDPTDEKLDFISKRDNVKPIAIFRIRDGEFFLCYNEFGFFVDKLGRRFRDDYLVFWTGAPNSFSYIAPYIIAIEPSHIEIRHVESGEIQQIIPTNSIRCLNNHPDILHLAMGLPQSDIQEIVKLVLISDSSENL